MAKKEYIIILLSTIHVLSGYQLPKDVEMMEGYEPPTSWSQHGGSLNADRKHNPNGILKAIRNRRALLYHIKGIPTFSNYQEEKIDGLGANHVVRRNLQKRDLSQSLGNMDVSAQFMEQLAIAQVDPRDKREVETTAKNNSDEIVAEARKEAEPQEWIPQPSIKDQEIESETSEGPNAEPLIDKQIGRGVRGAANEWVKLPFLARPLENEPLSSAITNNDDVSHRMPRVNFVTQNKGLQASESRSQRDSIPRDAYRRSELRTDIYPPNRDGRGRSLDYSSYSRQSYFYPDDYRRRGYYDDMDYYDDMYYQRRDPYTDRYDSRNSRRYDYDYRYKTPDDYSDYGRYDKPRRIIYYATLPDVVRTPPNVYRYPQNSYSRVDDDRYNRDNRYDYSRGGFYYPRYPYSALKKADNEGPRDLTVSSTANKEKAAEAKRQQEMQKKNDERARDVSLNSHQYPINLSANLNVDNTKVPHQTLYHDITRMDNDYHRYDHPSFQAAVDDPYVSRHD